MIKLINYHIRWLYFDAISTRRNWIFQQTILCSALDKNLSIVLAGQKSASLQVLWVRNLLSTLTIQIITANHWFLGCRMLLGHRSEQAYVAVSALCFSWIGGRGGLVRMVF